MNIVMKRIVFFLILTFFIFSLANARSLSIDIDTVELDAYSDIRIDYKIELYEEETFFYEIGIRNEEVKFTLLEKNVTTELEDESIVWDVENFPAGEYEAYIFIEPDITWTSRKFEILPEFNFHFEKEILEFFIYDEDVTKSFEIENIGNVPFFISLSTRGIKSRAELLPMTYEIEINETRNFLISIEKPNEHYEAYLNIEASWADKLIEETIDLKVYNPIVEINVENIELIEKNDSQILTGKIMNEGNVYRNITLVFNVDGEEKIENMILETNETLEINESFSNEKNLNYLEIRYINSEGEEDEIRENFDTLLSFPGESFLNLDTLKNNFNYLILGIIILILVLFLIKRKKVDNK